MRALACLALLLVACGGESDCEKLGKLMCQKACACAEGDACRFAYGGSATVSFDRESDCVGLYVTLGCSGDEDPVMDPPACMDLMEAAACVSTTQGMALAFPEGPACE